MNLLKKGVEYMGKKNVTNNKYMEEEKRGKLRELGKLKNQMGPIRI